MLNNIYTAECTYNLESDSKTKTIYLRGDIAANNEKEAVYKAKCILKEHVKDISTLSKVEVYLTKCSKFKQLIKLLVAQKIKIEKR